MIFSEEDLKRLRARERRTLRGAAGTALLGGALPVFGQTPPVKPNDDMYVMSAIYKKHVAHSKE